MASTLPWDTGQFMPWMVGQAFVGPDGAVYTAYPDTNSPTGYTVKRVDQNGESFQPVNAPYDMTKQYAWMDDPNNPYGRRLAAAEQAQAQQNKFEQGIKQGDLALRQQTGAADIAYKQSLVKQAKDDLAFRYYQQNQQNAIAQGGLGLNTLQLGASLHGPRNWDSYLETASQAGQNPILNQAMDTWSSLTNVRPNTGRVNGPMPQRFDLNALASDFMGGGGGQSRELPRDANLDLVAMQPGAASAGWWQGLSGDEKQRAMGYWEKRGWSPDSVLNSLAYTAPTQNFAYSGA